MDLWTEIGAARREAGLSQQSLADGIEVRREAVARLELGTGSVGLTLRVMAAIPMRLMGVAKGLSLLDQITNARIKRKWTVEKLAERADLDVRTVRSIERGEGSMASLNAVLAAVAPRAARQPVIRQFWDGDTAKVAETDCRFTPPQFIAAITEVFGQIDLDPCSHAQANVGAKRSICLPDCGLATAWEGRLVYVNPPYGSLANWVGKANREWERGQVQKLLFLLPAARLHVREFFDKTTKHATTLILRERLRFSRLDGRSYPSPFTMALACFGCSTNEIKDFCQHYPSLVIPPR